MKKINIKHCFLILFILFFTFNFVYQEFLYNKLNKIESTKLNSTILKNASILTDNELLENGPNQIELLKNIYEDNGDIKSLASLIELQSKNGVSLDLEKYIELINLNEDSFNFKKAAQYTKQAYPLMTNVQKMNANLRLSNYELAFNDIDKSIEYSNKALDIILIESESSLKEQYYELIKNRISILKNIKSDFISENPVNAYKKIFKSNNIFYSPSVCKYLLDFYESNFSKNHKSDFIDLKNVYDEYYS